MKKTLILATLLAAAAHSQAGVFGSETVVVANRGGGSLSVINAKNDQVKRTVSIAGSEPMYVVYVPKTDRLYVGDRKQNKVHVLHPGTFKVQRSITVGNGVFHMWADGKGKQLWVNNDVDNTISVINLADNSVSTIKVDAKPHDVYLTKDGKTAFVSLLIDGAPDKVYAYDTATLSKTGETVVGEDPHLFFMEQAQQLYVPCQTGGIYVLNRNLSAAANTVALTGTHGIFGSRDGQFAYVTNLPGNQLYTVDTSSQSLVGTALNTTVVTPHNVVINKRDNKLFVTHSGPVADKVTVYSVSPEGALAQTKVLTAGVNPFGITYYKR